MDSFKNLASALAFVCISSGALAAPGDIDTTFGTNGVVTRDFGAVASAVSSVTELPDGKLLVSGTVGTFPNADFAMARYLADGTPDASFGSGGLVVTDFLGGNDTRGVLAVQPDGKLVLGGHSTVGGDEVISLMRFLSDGTLDTTFGTNGKATGSISGVDIYMRDLALQDDGKIVALGNSTNGSGNDELLLVRFLADGTIDTGFGTNGVFSIEFSSGTDAFFHAVEIQADGKILAGGRFAVNGSGTGHDFAVFRCLSDGSNLDAGFGSGGGVILSDDDLETIHDIGIQADGRILLGGSVSGSRYGVARILDDGTPDTTFDGSGISTFGSSVLGQRNAMAIQPDGRVLVSVLHYNGGAKASVFRLEPDGSLDNGFGVGGLAESSVDADDTSLAVAILGDGNIVIAGGTSSAQIDYDFFLTRLEGGNAAPQGGFDAGGTLTTQIGTDSALLDLAIQSDGKFFAAGSVTIGGQSDFGLARYLPDGALDTSFTSDGIVTTDFFGEDDYLGGVVIQPDGKILAAGGIRESSVAKAALVRYLPDGSLDPTFGTGGKAISSLVTYVEDVALQADGKIVVVTSFDNEFQVVRFHSDGSVDTSFGTAGKLSVDVGVTDAACYTVAIQENGRILFGGFASDSSQGPGVDRNFRIFRCLPNGTLDTSFAGDGDFELDLSAQDFADDIVLQPDGKILVAGRAWTLGISLFRLLSDGTLDSTFNGTGISYFSGTLGGVWPTGLALQYDGKILRSTMESQNGDQLLAATQHLANGTADSGFGTSGLSISQGVVDANYSRRLPLVLFPNGDFLMGGTNGNSGDREFTIVKLEGDRFPRINVEEPEGTTLSGGGTVDFGDVNTGESVEKTFTIRNLGSQNLTGIAVSLQGSNVVFPRTNPGATSLAPGASTTFTVSFSPTLTGADAALLHIDSNDTVQGGISLSLTGNGVAPEIVVEEPEHVGTQDGTSSRLIGNTPVGVPVSRVFTIRNTGDGILHSLAASFTGTHAAEFSASAFGATSLNPGESTTVTVTFTPAAGGTRTANFAIANNDADENPYDLVVAGVGFAPEIAVEEPAGNGRTDGVSVVDFGHIYPAQNTVRTLTIRNTGNEDLTGLGVSVDGANAADFSPSSLSSTTLAAGETTTFTVTFAPSAVGTRNAAIHLSSNDADENPFDLDLTGVGADPEISVEQPVSHALTDGVDSVDFGSGNTGQPISKSFTIRNSGTTDLIGLSASFSGDDANDFSAGALAASLAPGASTTLEVTFTPSAEGVRVADLHIASNDQDENPFDVSLTGTGLTGEIGVEQPAGNDLTDGSSTVDCGNVGVNLDSVREFTIRNSGAGDLSGLTLSVSGGNASDFTIAGPGATSLSPSGTTTFTVTFRPSGAGVRNAILQIGSSDVDENPFDISLTGQGLDPEISVEEPVSTPLTDGVGVTGFGPTGLGETNTRTFTVRNTGTLDLTGLATALTGAGPGFSVTPPLAPTLAPGATTTFEVSFSPAATGAQSGTLEIASNDRDENPFRVSLSASGVYPDSDSEVEVPASGADDPPASPIGYSSDTAGNYWGLIRDSSAAPGETKLAGFVQGKITHVAKRDEGAASFSISYDGVRYGLKGVFATGQITAFFTKKDEARSEMTVTLELHETDRGRKLFGSLTGDGTVHELELFQREFHPKKNPADGIAGSYTFVFPADEAADHAVIPGGDGVAAGAISTGGTARINAILGDGTKTTLSAFVGPDLELMFFRPLYRGTARGFIGGEMAIRKLDNLSDADGTLQWVKGALEKEKLYPLGFDLQQPAVASAFSRPNVRAGERLISTFNDDDPNGSILFQDGNLSHELGATDIHWTTKNRFLIKEDVIIDGAGNVRNGLVTGRYIDKENGVKFRYQAVVFQSQNLITGHFTGNGETGYVRIESLFEPELDVTKASDDSALSSGATVSLGTVGVDGGIGEVDIRLSNSGEGNLKFLSEPAWVGENNGFGFSVVSAGNIFPGTSQILRLRFDPEVEGPQSITLRLETNDRDNHPFELTVTGQGEAGSNSFSDLDPSGTDHVTGTTPAGGVTGSGVPWNAATHPGKYEGLVTRPAAANAVTGFGKFTVRHSAKTGLGVLSGSAWVEGQKVVFKGAINGDGNFEGTTSAGFDAVLHLAETGNGPQLTGTITREGTGEVFELVASRGAYHSRNHPATAFAGRYTMLIPANRDLGLEVPGGDGFGTITIKTSGLVRGAYRLGDGRVVSTASYLNADDQWTVYRALYSGHDGFLAGILTLRDIGGVSDFDGELHWRKPPLSSERQYENGFDLRVNAVGSVFAPPASGETVLDVDLGAAENLRIDLERGGISDGEMTFLSDRNRVTPTDRIRIRINSGNGTFSGKWTDETNRVTIRGALFQKQNLGGGMFVRDDLTGYVLITPDP